MDNQLTTLGLPNTLGKLVIFRQGAYMGCNKNFDIYLNEQPYGEVACKDKVELELEYGAYTIHFTCGKTKKCKDITIELTQEEPIVYIKTYVKALMWKNVIYIEKCQEKDIYE